MRFEGGVLVSLHSPNWIFDHDLIEYGCAVAWLPIAGNHHPSSQRFRVALLTFRLYLDLREHAWGIKGLV
jgi:hypothetical protein